MLFTFTVMCRTPFTVTVTVTQPPQRILMSFSNAHWWLAARSSTVVSESLLRTSLHGVKVIGEDFNRTKTPLLGYSDLL